MAAARYYYDPARPSAFSTAEKLWAAVKKPVGTWLERQDAYTLHRQVRKRFPRNPYSVNNVMDVWECDLVTSGPSPNSTAITSRY